MIEISREEFEERVQDLIDGKITRKKLIKELKTDSRTLNNKIREMSTYNPELYSTFVSEFPYRTKERNDIDYEALVIEIVTTGMTSAEAASKYDLGVRTIQRRVNDLEKENPYLVGIYKEVKNNNKHQIKPSLELQYKIENLVMRPVIMCEINGKKEQELEEIERIYNERCLTMSKEEAARSMGLNRERIFKLMNQLRRIRTENNIRNFRNGLKVQGIENDLSSARKKTGTDKDKVVEGEEK